MARIPNWLSTYFTFHRKERNGLTIVLCLIALVIGYNVYLRITLSDRLEKERLVFGPSIAEFNARIDTLGTEEEDENFYAPRTPEKDYWTEAVRFPFDPNTLDSAGWVRLGFSPKQSASIIRYRSKGATFYKPQDLMRLYMMDSARYKDLLPFVNIAPQPTRSAPSSFPRYERPAPAMVDINLADTIQLTELKGIGPAFARRIFKYRERLGGFRTINQLYEVYGMDSARIQGLIDQITLDTSNLRYININTADFKQLIQNPYLNKNQVGAIIRYREQHGPYRSITDLKKIHLITPEIYTKAAPHLTTD